MLVEIVPGGRHECLPPGLKSWTSEPKRKSGAQIERGLSDAESTIEIELQAHPTRGSTTETASGASHRSRRVNPVRIARAPAGSIRMDRA